MNKTTLYKGASFHIYALDNPNDSLKDFLENLNESDLTSLLALIKRAGDVGPPKNIQKFRLLRNGIYELKSKQVRIPCFFDKGRIILCTHGFIKKGNKTPKREIDKAEKLMKEYMEGKK